MEAGFAVSPMGIVLVALATALIIFSVARRLPKRTTGGRREFNLYVELEGQDGVQQVYDCLTMCGASYGNLQLSEDLARGVVVMKLSAATADIGSKEDVLHELRRLACVKLVRAR